MGVGRDGICQRKRFAFTPCGAASSSSPPVDVTAASTAFPSWLTRANWVLAHTGGFTPSRTSLRLTLYHAKPFASHSARLLYHSRFCHAALEALSSKVWVPSRWTSQ